MSDKTIAQKFGPGVPPLSELEKHTLVALVNTNPLFDPPQPLPPNVIPVAGLHIQASKKLPSVKEKKNAINLTFFSKFNFVLLKYSFLAH